MIIIDTKDLERAYDELKEIPGGATTAIKRAINYGVKKSKTLIDSHIRKIYNVQKKTVFEGLKGGERWAKDTNLTGGIISSAPHILWNKFKLLPKSPFIKNKKGEERFAQQGRLVTKRKAVSVKLYKNQPSREYGRGIFIARTKKHGWINAFMRADKKGEENKPPSASYPIKSMSTIGVSEMMTSHKVIPAIQKEVHEATIKELVENINLLITGSRKGK
jgi:hypothetical protein